MDVGHSSQKPKWQVQPSLQVKLILSAAHTLPTSFTNSIQQTNIIRVMER